MAILQPPEEQEEESVRPADNIDTSPRGPKGDDNIDKFVEEGQVAAMAMDRKRKGSKAARRGTSHVLMQKKKKKDFIDILNQIEF